MSDREVDERKRWEDRRRLDQWRRERDMRRQWRMGEGTGMVSYSTRGQWQQSVCAVGKDSGALFSLCAHHRVTDCTDSVQCAGCRCLVSVSTSRDGTDRCSATWRSLGGCTRCQTASWHAVTRWCCIRLLDDERGRAAAGQTMRKQVVRRVAHTDRHDTPTHSQRASAATLHCLPSAAESEVKSV